MTRFDADDPTERRRLFADAITAHRERTDSFLTLEADAIHGDGPASVAFDPHDPPSPDNAIGTDELADDGDWEPAADEAAAPDNDPADPPPWIQFAEDTFNLDCTDTEYERLTTVVDDYPEFRIDELHEPEAADGRNVRITARSDANRLAGFAERVFRDVYELPEEYRVWVTDL